MQDDTLAQIHTSGIFIDDNVLDMGAGCTTADVLCFEENGASGYDGLSIVDGDDGVTDGCATLLFDEGCELIGGNWRRLC